MLIRELLSEALILPRIRAREGHEVIEELARHLADHHPGVRREEIARVLLEREEAGSTAIGEGLAVPHGKLDSVDRPIACLGRTREGIDFGAQDGLPTKFFFVLIAPAAPTGEHLKTLARISRLFRKEELRKRLLDAETAADMHRVIAAEEA